MIKIYLMTPWKSILKFFFEEEKKKRRKDKINVHDATSFFTWSQVNLFNSYIYIKIVRTQHILKIFERKETLTLATSVFFIFLKGEFEMKLQLEIKIESLFPFWYPNCEESSGHRETEKTRNCRWKRKKQWKWKKY